MAKTNRNFLTHNYSGKVGRQYSLRNRGDNSFIAQLPKKPRFISASTALTQEAVKEKFQQASMYAKKAMQDEALKEQYAAARRGTQTAFNVAFLDYYKAPKLSDLRIDEYKGLAGQPIMVKAVDNFRIKKVKFTLISADGTELEEGEAVEGTNGVHWVYTTQQANPSLPGTIVRVTATDIPDNRTILEKVL